MKNSQVGEFPAGTVRVRSSQWCPRVASSICCRGNQHLFRTQRHEHLLPNPFRFHPHQSFAQSMDHTAATTPDPHFAVEEQSSDMSNVVSDHQTLHTRRQQHAKRQHKYRSAQAESFKKLRQLSNEKLRQLKTNEVTFDRLLERTIHFLQQAQNNQLQLQIHNASNMS